MKHCIRTKQKNIKYSLLALFLAFTQSSFANIVLDLPGKDSKGTYNVEIRREDSLYSVIVTQVTKAGESEVIYESNSLSMVPKGNIDIYSDRYIRVLDPRNGKGSLFLDNGQSIKAELGN